MNFPTSITGSFISLKTRYRVNPISAVNTSPNRQQDKSRENEKEYEKIQDGKTTGDHPKNYWTT